MYKTKPRYTPEITGPKLPSLKSTHAIPGIVAIKPLAPGEKAPKDIIIEFKAFYPKLEAKYPDRLGSMHLHVTYKGVGFDLRGIVVKYRSKDEKVLFYPPYTRYTDEAGVTKTFPFINFDGIDLKKAILLYMQKNCIKIVHSAIFDYRKAQMEKLKGASSPEAEKSNAT